MMPANRTAGCGGPADLGLEDRVDLVGLLPGDL